MMELTSTTGALAICRIYFNHLIVIQTRPVFLSDKLFDKQQYDNTFSDNLFEGLATKYIYDTDVNTLQIIFSFSLPRVGKCFFSLKDLQQTHDF